MDFAKELARQQKESQRRLVEFLDAELKLAATLCSMAQTTRRNHRRVEILAKVQTAIDSIRHFEGRIADLKLRDEVHAQAGQIAEFVAKHSGPN